VNVKPANRFATQGDNVVYVLPFRARNIDRINLLLVAPNRNGVWGSGVCVRARPPLRVRAFLRVVGILSGASRHRGESNPIWVRHGSHVIWVSYPPCGNIASVFGAMRCSICYWVKQKILRVK
jgi:hypothetical protein